MTIFDTLRWFLFIHIIILTSAFVFFPIETGREFVLMFGTIAFGFLQYLIDGADLK